MNKEAEYLLGIDGGGTKRENRQTSFEICRLLFI